MASTLTILRAGAIRPAVTKVVWIFGSASASTPVELRTFVLAEIRKMRRIVKNSGAKVD